MIISEKINSPVLQTIKHHMSLLRGRTMLPASSYSSRVMGPVAGVKEASETLPSLAEKLFQDSQLARTEAEGVGTML